MRMSPVIRQRYFRPTDDHPEGVIEHFQDCAISKVGICTCGLLHDLRNLEDSETIYEKFTDEAYVILVPTYPIVLEAGESINTTIVTSVGVDEKSVPIGTDAELIIEVHYGAKKFNTKKIPFYLSQENADSDNVLLWLKPEDKEN